MLGTLLRLVKVDLEHQFVRLKREAEGLKDRAIGEVKASVISTGITIGLVIVGTIFVLLTCVIGLMALYVSVAAAKGPLVALGAVGGTTAIVAVLLFIIAASRGRAQSPGPVSSPVPPPAVTTVRNASMGEALKSTIVKKTAGVAEAIFDEGAAQLRKSPRPALFATIALAVVVGIVVGRNR